MIILRFARNNHMRKLNKGRKFSRKLGPRKAMFKALANAFILNGKIRTTEAKAKEMRPKIEKMITRAKQGGLFATRLLAQDLPLEAVNKLVKDIAPIYKDRKGGYTRITKLGQRQVDGARMAILELVK